MKLNLLYTARLLLFELNNLEALPLFFDVMGTSQDNHRGIENRQQRQKNEDGKFSLNNGCEATL